MAHSYHHALSSARRWGGTPGDFIAIHSWMDGSKELLADFRHRALRHHAEGIFLAVIWTFNPGGFVFEWRWSSR